uniref:Uncharacterized protein n=1 Tax=Rhizophora mucronata TaxID=61149 RepID=A0A2P2LVN0_RHIMU
MICADKALSNLHLCAEKRITLEKWRNPRSYTIITCQVSP